MRKVTRFAALPLLATALTIPMNGVQAQEEYLYVAIQGEAKVAVVDMASLEEVERIDLRTLGFTENAKPHHIAVEPGGAHWYLSLIGENRVLKFDRHNDLVDQAEFEVPGMLAVHPTDDLLLVGRSMSAVNPPERIGVIRRSDMDVEEMDVFFPRPHALTLTPDGERVYSASLAVNQLAAIDVASEDMELSNLEGPTHTLVQFAVSPDGSTLVGTGQLTGVLLIFDLTDPDGPALRDQVAVGRQPWHPIYHPTENVAYFGVKMDHKVVAVNTDTGEILWETTDPGINNPHGAAISMDGRHLFVSSNGPGGMQMGGTEMAAGDEHEGHERGGHHEASEDGHAMDHQMDHQGEHEATTGTVTVLDTRDGSVVKVLEMGSNTTGVGSRSR